jgi:hypothetical protein
VAPEKYLLYLIFRLFDHQFAPFKFFVHISKFISHSPQLDWSRFISYSETYGMQRLVNFTIKLVHDTLGTNVPDHLSKNRILGYTFLKHMVFTQNFHSRSNPHLIMLCYTLLLMSPQNALKCTLTRIFPTKSEIRLRYKLNSNSKSVYLYMVLNPFLMLFRKKWHLALTDSGRLPEETTTIANPWITYCALILYRLPHLTLEPSLHFTVSLSLADFQQYNSIVRNR